MIGDQGGSSPQDAPPPSNGPAPAAGTKPKPPGGGGGDVRRLPPAHPENHLTQLRPASLMQTCMQRAF